MSNSTARLKRYHTPAEVGEILGIGRTTVYEMLHAGEIPSIRIGRQYRIPIDQFEKWEATRLGASAELSA